MFLSDSSWQAAFQPEEEQAERTIRIYSQAFSNGVGSHASDVKRHAHSQTSELRSSVPVLVHREMTVSSVNVSASEMICHRLVY